VPAHAQGMQTATAVVSCTVAGIIPSGVSRTEHASLHVYSDLKGGKMEVVTIVRRAYTRGDVFEFQSELSTVCDRAFVNIRPGKLVLVEGSYHARLKVWHSGLGLVLVAFGDEGAWAEDLLDSMC